MNCVYCQSAQVVKNGIKTLKSNQMLQRYLCKACSRRFNERSGTPMARLRTPAATVEMALNTRHEGLGINPQLGAAPLEFGQANNVSPSAAMPEGLLKMGFIERPLTISEMLLSRGFECLTP